MILDNLLPAIPVDRLRGRIATAHADLEKAKTAFEDAAYAAEETPGAAADKRRDAAHRQLLEAEKWLASVQAAYQRALVKEAERQQQQADAALAARWQSVKSYGDKREAAAREVEIAVEALSKAFRALWECTDAMRIAHPAPDVDSGLLTELVVISEAKIQLQRAGLWSKWHPAGKWSWDFSGRLSLLGKIKEANVYLLSLRKTP